MWGGGGPKGSFFIHIDGIMPSMLVSLGNFICVGDIIPEEVDGRSLYIQQRKYQKIKQSRGSSKAAGGEAFFLG